MFAICRLVAFCLILLSAPGLVAAQTTSEPYLGDRLAFISGGKLYVGFPHPRLVPGPGNAFQPVFSYDGNWLAFLRQHWNGYDVSSQLWLARANGNAAHAILPMGGVSVGGFQWSPSADVLAVQPIGASGAAPIRLVPAQGKPKAVPDQLAGPFLWSSDGRTLAIANTSHDGYTRLYTVSGAAVRSYSVPDVNRYDRVRLAGWWPDGHSILYWIDLMGSGSLAADGMQLLALDFGTGRARHLGITLGYRDWIASSGKRLLAVKGGDRTVFFGKQLQLCLPTGPCKALPGVPSGKISIDPAWAPTGGQIAFVVAPAWHTWGFRSPARYRRWLDAHILWTAQPNGTGARPTGAEVPRGVQDPEWTRDGRGILFVKGGALWLDPHLGAANPYPVAQLVPAHFVPDLQKPAFQNWYYGHMDWHSLFAWY